MEISRALMADLAKTFILPMVLVCFLSSLVLATTINSQFSCSNTNAETTYYYELRSPGLGESGYTKGLNAGSEEYYKGDKAILDSTMSYYDGRVDPQHTSSDRNASVTSTLNVDFSGNPKTSKGISEFDAQGFYTDNRAVSAWKDFWFNSQSSYPTNNISVQATAAMNLKGVYNVQYHGVADNAYFVFSDTAGLSNKTGARRIDWEQEGLLKGKNLDVTNNLVASNFFYPRAGAEDWLPCTCLSGMIPLVEPKGGDWPSWQAYAVLQPQDLKLEKECPNGNCGALLYLNYANGAGPLSPYYASGAGALSPLTWQNLPPVQVESFFKVPDRTKVEYTINVRNIGTDDVNDVIIVDKLANDTTYVGGSATIDYAPQEPIIQRVNNVQQLTLKLGDLLGVTGPSGVKTIRFAVDASQGDPATLGTDNTAYAAYRIGTNPKDTLPAVPSTEIPIHTAD